MSSPSEAEGVVRGYCAAWMAGDVDALLGLYRPDLTLVWPGSHRLAGTHDGLDDSLMALAQLQVVTNRKPIELVDVLVSDQRTMAIVVEEWTQGSERLEPLRALDFVVEDAMLRHCRIFERDQHAVDAWVERWSR